MIRLPRRSVWLPLSVLFTVVWWFLSPFQPIGHSQRVATCPANAASDDTITALTRKADKAWDQQSANILKHDDLAAAARRYREVRGRQPFPGFAEWYQYARHEDALIPEEFFDQIYTDLEPYWGVEPAALRASVTLWGEKTMKIRNGELVDRDDERFRTFVVAEMAKTVAYMLPDMDVACNFLDEPRVFAPWELVNKSMHAAAKQKVRMNKVPLSQFSQAYKNMPEAFPGLAPTDGEHKPVWSTDRLDMCEATRAACSPDTKLRSGNKLNARSEHTLISNVTAARDVCTHPEFLDTHGFFLGADSVVITRQLVPVFSSSKLSVNNDILVPEPAYWADGDTYEARTYWGRDASLQYSWARKHHGLIWRGGATGGTNCQAVHESHRHRFIRVLNATHIIHKERSNAELAQWVSESADVRFTNLFCTEEGDQYTPAAPMQMARQYKWKYLPDVDGNTVSGRFRALMRSNSAVMKQTIFAEWHDSRLMAWKHYIPVNTAFSDLYRTMTYFLGRKGADDKCAHDNEGKKIAIDGSKWSERVLRRVDMQVYMLRLLFEYARVVDDKRDHLGFVQDLLQS